MKKIILIILLSPLLTLAQTDSVFSISFDADNEVFYSMPSGTHDSLDLYDSIGLAPSYYFEHRREVVSSDGRINTVLYLTYPPYEFAEWITKPAKIVTDYDSILMYDSSDNIMSRRANPDSIPDDSFDFITYYYASPLFNTVSDSNVYYLTSNGYTFNANNDSIVWFVTDTTSDFYDIENLVHEYKEFNSSGEEKYIRTTSYSPGENNDLVNEFVIETTPYNYHGKCLNRVSVKHFYNLTRNFYNESRTPSSPILMSVGILKMYQNYTHSLFGSQKGNTSQLKVTYDGNDRKPILIAVSDLYGRVILDNVLINNGINHISMPEQTKSGVYILIPKQEGVNKVKILFQNY